MRDLSPWAINRPSQASQMLTSHQHQHCLTTYLPLEVSKRWPLYLSGPLLQLDSSKQSHLVLANALLELYRQRCFPQFLEVRSHDTTCLLVVFRGRLL